jgi:alginate O-acetyltransferase complex protein AlgI
MLFNSIEFAFFLPVVYLLYWYVFNRNLKIQNLFVVFASCFFYGWWDWHFLGLILFSTTVDYFVGQGLRSVDSKGRRKLLLWTSIIVNIGLLGVFKYYNFFVANFIDAFTFFGKDFSPSTLNIILPVGISFYTFQTLSYTLDVYKRKLEPTKDFVAFAAFVSFFPQLVAGPIERATNLLPQFYKKRSFDYNLAVDGLRQILWGLFKKVVIADSCAVYVNIIFENSGEYSGSTLFIGALLFAFQIYGDFSGYSDIAIGTSKLFGFKLNKNFATPYFSRNIAEFWRRWHISLSTWFRDYLYIPLGGSRGSVWMKIRNTFIIFAVSGFWHGANWTFIVWGVLNAIYIMPLILSANNRNHLDVVAQGKNLPSLREFGAMLLTFSLTVFAWVFFRAEDISEAFLILSKIFSDSLFLPVEFMQSSESWLTGVWILFMILIDWKGREHENTLNGVGLKWNKYVRYLFYYILMGIIIYMFWNAEEQQFIYFQF